MPAYKSKNGTWFFKCSINGRQFLRRGFASRKEAVQAEALFRMEGSSNHQKDSKKKAITFNELCKIYIQHIRKNLKISTAYTYEKRIMRYFLGRLPDIDVTKLKEQDFKKIENYLNKSNLKIKNDLLNLFKRMFDYLSIYHDINIKYPRRMVVKRVYEIKPLERVHSVDIDLIHNYYAASNNYFRLYLLFSLLYGLRISEVRGITLSSIQEDRLLIYKQIASKTGLKSYRVISPKTKSSNRSLLIPHFLKEKIVQHIRVNRLKDDNYLFCSVRSKKDPIGEQTIRTYFRNLEIKNHWQHFSPHQLRHTIATYLTDNGIPYEITGKFLGHDFKNVTMNVYIDLEENYTRQIYSLLEKLFDRLDKSESMIKL